jgi:stearoyl-CoA desaturase (delta-9 desaturase)
MDWHGFTADSGRQIQASVFIPQEPIRVNHFNHSDPIVSSEGSDFPYAAPYVPSTAPDQHEPPKISLAIRLATLGFVVGPFIGTIAAAWLCWGGLFGWSHLAVMLIMYALTGLGITVGFHRLFTHRSFQTTGPIRALFGILGCMAVEGPLLRWVADHRHHHKESDQEGDPHSPHLHGQGWKGLFKGIFHSHVGWLFTHHELPLQQYVPDLLKSRSIRTISALFPVWVLVSFLIPAGLGWLFVGNWTGALLGFIWGGLVRVFLVHHVTWSINSICHLWGSKPYETGDESRNNFIFGVLAMGEGWHNNHHAFPTSARHGFHWWQIDFSYWVIRSLEMLGLAWDVKVPQPQAIARENRRAA